jgi:hypothetical protein
MNASFADLKPAEKDILLAVVDKQVQDGMAALEAAGKTVTITLNEEMSPLMKDVYKEYCRAMGCKLKDVDRRTFLLDGKEKPTGSQATRKSIEDYRERLDEMVKTEQTKQRTHSL